MNMSSAGHATTAAAPAATDALRRAWLWTGIAAALILAGIALGPGEGGSMILLVCVLCGILLGLVALGRAFLLTIRALKEGRTLAIAALLVDSVLLFWGLVAILGSFGRFYGWDA